MTITIGGTSVVDYATLPARIDARVPTYAVAGGSRRMATIAARHGIFTPPE